MNVLIICLTVIIVVSILCGTAIYTREKQRFEEVITSPIFAKLQKEHDKLLGECKAINDYSNNCLKIIDDKNLSDDFIIEFCKNSFFTIRNLTNNYE